MFCILSDEPSRDRVADFIRFEAAPIFKVIGKFTMLCSPSEDWNFADEPLLEGGYRFLGENWLGSVGISLMLPGPLRSKD